MRGRRTEAPAGQRPVARPPAPVHVLLRERRRHTHTHHTCTRAPGLLQQAGRQRGGAMRSARCPMGMRRASHATCSASIPLQGPPRLARTAQRTLAPLALHAVGVPFGALGGRHSVRLRLDKRLHVGTAPERGQPPSAAAGKQHARHSLQAAAGRRQAAAPCALSNAPRAQSAHPGLRAGLPGEHDSVQGLGGIGGQRGERLVPERGRPAGQLALGAGRGVASQGPTQRKPRRGGGSAAPAEGAHGAPRPAPPRPRPP